MFWCPCPLCCGKPQGCNLCPLPFSIYSLPRDMLLFSLGHLVFADDSNPFSDIYLHYSPECLATDISLPKSIKCSLSPRPVYSPKNSKDFCVEEIHIVGPVHMMKRSILWLCKNLFPFSIGCWFCMLCNSIEWTKTARRGTKHDGLHSLLENWASTMSIAARTSMHWIPSYEF